MTTKLDFLLLAQQLEKFDITRIRVGNADIYLTCDHPVPTATNLGS